MGIYKKTWQYVLGGSVMNREEVLEKSRKENKGADLYEDALMKEGGNVAFGMVTALAVVFTCIQEFLEVGRNFGLWALVVAVPASGCIVRAFRTKDRWDIVRAAAGCGAVLLYSVLYIRELLAAASVLA